MSLRDRWGKRGPAWRFPTREEGAENLKSAFGVFKRPWFIILLALAAAALILCAATGSTGALKVVGIVSVTILATTMRMYAASQR